jgi:hypothetical protein
MTNSNEVTPEKRAELEDKYADMSAKMLHNKEIFQAAMYTLTQGILSMEDNDAMAMPKQTVSVITQALAFTNATLHRMERLENERLARVRASN